MTRPHSSWPPGQAAQVDADVGQHPHAEVDEHDDGKAAEQLDQADQRDPPDPAERRAAPTAISVPSTIDSTIAMRGGLQRVDDALAEQPPDGVEALVAGVDQRTPLLHR